MNIKKSALVPVVGLFVIGALAIGCAEKDNKKGPRLRNASQEKTVNQKATQGVERLSIGTEFGPCYINDGNEPVKTPDCRAVLAVLDTNGADPLNNNGANPLKNIDGQLYQQTPDNIKINGKIGPNGEVVAEYTNEKSKRKPKLKVILLTSGNLESTKRAKTDHQITVDEKLDKINAAEEIANLRITETDHVLLLSDIEKIDDKSDTIISALRQAITDTVKRKTNGQKYLDIVFVKDEQDIDAAKQIEKSRIQGFILPLVFEITGTDAKKLNIKELRIDEKVLSEGKDFKFILLEGNSSKIVLIKTDSIKRVDFKLILNGSLTATE